MKETIKTLREKNNYSQATVAKYLNISRQMYIKYENGEAEPPVKVVVSLSKLYKVDYDHIIDNLDKDVNKKNKNDTASCNANQNLYDISEKPDNLFVASPTVAYGSSKSDVANNNFELIKTIIPKLNIFEQLQILSLLASSIGKNGANEISNSVKKWSLKKGSKLNNLSEQEKNELFQKFSGCLKGVVVEDPKDFKDSAVKYLSPDEYLTQLKLK